MILYKNTQWKEPHCMTGNNNNTPEQKKEQIKLEKNKINFKYI